MTVAEALTLKAGDEVTITEDCGRYGCYGLVVRVEEFSRERREVRVSHEKWLPGSSLWYPIRMAEKAS